MGEDKILRKTPLCLLKVMLKTKQLAVNCDVVDGDYVLKEGDVIMHTMHKHEHAVLDLDVEVVHDSKDMLVVSKPSSWPIHPVSNYRMNTLTFVLQKEMGYTDLRAMHRIDAATSGICMMAKGWGLQRCAKQNIKCTLKVGKQVLVSPTSSGLAQLARSTLPWWMGGKASSILINFYWWLAGSLRNKLSAENLWTDTG